MPSLRRSVAFATETLILPVVPKNRRPKFELHLRIIDLNNVPLVSGRSFVKWNLAHSTAANHRGRTESKEVEDHKVLYNYDVTVPLRLTVDKNSMLSESFIEFEVMQEYVVGGKSERITLGHVKLNLAEYVEQSELGGESEEPGVTRRYLMQESKVNSTLKLGIYMRQIDGDKNFVAPALKTAQVFSGIAGIVTGEQADIEESGSTPSLHVKTRETGELQDMYRRTLAAYWSAQPGELKADEAIEDMFAGGDGWGDREKPYNVQRHGIRFLTDSGVLIDHLEPQRMSRSNSHRKSHETLRPGDMNSSQTSIRGRGSLEQQAQQMKAEADRKRYRSNHELDELDLREDLCSWRRPAS